MKLQLFYPIKPFTVTQGFGENQASFYHELGMLGHNGLDCTAKDGQPIYSAMDGVVTFSGEDGSGGLGVVVRSTEQYDYKDGQAYFKSIYWHIKPNTFKVKPGDIVKVGDQLACADNTGLSTGTHLHFGLKPVQKGEQEWEWFNIEQNAGYLGAIDPRPYFNGIYAEDAQGIIIWLKKIIEMLKKILSQ